LRRWRRALTLALSLLSLEFLLLLLGQRLLRERGGRQHDGHSCCDKRNVSQTTIKRTHHARLLLFNALAHRSPHMNLT
jgi:hypothetical protein